MKETMLPVVSVVFEIYWLDWLHDILEYTVLHTFIYLINHELMRVYLYSPTALWHITRIFLINVFLWCGIWRTKSLESIILVWVACFVIQRWDCFYLILFSWKKKSFTPSTFCSASKYIFHLLVTISTAKYFHSFHLNVTKL